MMIMAVTVFVVRRTQVVAVDVTKPQHPLEDASEGELKQWEEE